MAIGSVNTFAINERQINSSVIVTGAGTMVSVEQTVRIEGSGTFVQIEQEVQLLETGSGTMVSIEQLVEATASGSIVTIEQRVIDSSPAVPTHEQRTGWDATLLVGGVTIPLAEIHGNIMVTKTENSSSLLTVTMIPPTGVQDLDFWQGKAVTLDMHTNETSTYRVFTGVVDIPEVDIIEQKITLRCTNRRRELINTTLTTVVPNIGYYSSEIFNEADELAKELDDRLSTVPYSLDFDGYNNYRYIAWEPKSTADYVWDDADIYYATPQVELSSRGRIVNTINIDFEYRYPRIHNKEVQYSWTSPVQSDVCLILVDGYSMTPRAAIESAIAATGWPLRGNVSYGDVPADGFYRCDILGTYAAFTTRRTTVSTTIKRDADGNAITGVDGNPVTETNRTSISDVRNLLAGSATWNATFRWAQDISEKFTLTVKSPQSVTQYGTIENDVVYGVESSYNTEDWENYTQYTDEGQGSLTYAINKDTNLATFNSASVTAIRVASTKIISTHRDTRVRLFRSILPELELHHTVEATADKISCKGKTRKIIHTLNVNTGEAKTVAEIALSRATGSGSSSTLSPPTRPSDTLPSTTDSVTLGNHFGKDPTTEKAKQWNGMIGNAILYQSGRTTYPESFVVDAPAIPGTQRDHRILTKAQTYNVEIRNDSLTVDFDD